MSFSSRSCSVAFVLLSAVASALATDRTWTGLGANSNWSTTGNWSDNAVPSGSSDVAIFPSGTPTNVVLDQSISLQAIYFRNPGMTLTVASGVNLAFNSSGSQTIIAEQDATINGAGTLNSGTGTLFYEGAGKITLALANTYTTPTTVKAGSTVVAQNNSAFGTADSGTTIEAGGTLDVGGTLGNNALNLGTEVFTVSGSGVSSNGAIVNNGANSQMQTFGRVEMAGDTWFGGSQRWDLRNNSAYLNMNGHNLTKVGNNNVVFVNTTVTPGTGNIDITSGLMQLEGGTRLNGSSANTMHVESGAALMYWYLSDDATATPWSLVLENLSKVRVDGGSANQDIWRGPITLNGLARLDSNNFYLYLNGAISGTGSIENVSGGYSYLNNTNNTYSGTTTASSGAIYASDPGALPGYASGKVTVKSGGAIAVRVSNGTAGWTLSQIHDLATATTFTAPDATLGIDTSLADMNYGYTLPLYKLGTGTLTLNTPGQTLNGQIKASGGELVMNGTTINATNVESHIGIYGGESAKVTLASNTVWSSIQPAKSVWCPILYVGESGKGVLAVKDNASLTHRFNVGQNNGSAGAVYQSGGTVTNWGGGSTDARIGQNGYGYYELGGGSLTFKGWSQLGVAPASVGLLKVSGGSFTQLSDFDGTLGLSRGGTGVVYVTGGAFTTASADLWVGDPNENSASGGFAEFTLAGGKATVNGGTGVQMANRDNMKAMVNLNGGVLEASQIRKEIRNNSRAAVGFNGGTFRSRTSGALFGTGSYAPDAVGLYAGGATFDTTNYACSVPVPLSAPKGLGVSGIAITSTSGYIGPPMVTISGGGGTGATAVAQFDVNSGTVNGITVTCPGFGYTSLPTVTLSGGGASSQAPVTGVYLLPNTSGGLTKLGAGLLALNATNTYAGATEVREGTLRLGSASALSPLSSVSVTGGHLDLGGNTLSNGNVTVTGGTLDNGTLAIARLDKNGAGTLVLGTAISLNTNQATQALTPGLWEGRIASQWDASTPNPKQGVKFTTSAVNGWCNSGGTINGMLWPDNSTYVYSGYIWNQTGTNTTWTFAENFDDRVLLTIDGSTVLNDGTWNNPSHANVTLTPGPHAFEARFGQGGGGAAGNVSGWWTDKNVSFMVDFSGRNSEVLSNYQLLTDPGDGSLLTLDAPDTHGAGLVESVIQQSWNTTDAGTRVSRQLTTRAGNGSKTANTTYAGGLWSGNNHTWIYTGILWNRASTNVTWTWRFTFDDNVMLTIDSNVVKNVALGQGVVYQNQTLTPGPHTIEVRFGDGTSDVGPADGRGGLTYDPQARGSTDPNDYILLQDPGNGSLLSTTVESGTTYAHAVVNVNEGTLRIAAPAVGLYEGRIASAWDTTTANPKESVQTTTRAVNGNCGEYGYINGAYWPVNSTYVYTGYIWNRTGTNTTWTFAENFDDDVLLVIDGTTVLNDTGWNNPSRGNITLTPGPHAFEARFGQGGGGAAGNASGWWNNANVSFMVDFQGRNEGNLSNFQLLSDPGSGSLLTLTAVDPLAGQGPLTDAEVNLANGATLDLNGASNKVAVLAGAGTVTNGILAAGTVISPAGDTAVGTLALSNVSFSSGLTYRLTVSGTQCDRLTFAGTLDLSGTTIVPSTANDYTASTYVIATASGGFTGNKPALSGFPSKYKIIKYGTDLQLTSRGGTVVILW